VSRQTERSIDLPCMMPAMPRVLVVDDEENIRLVLRTMLRKHGYEVQVAASAEEALEIVDDFTPDFVIADVRMGGMSGIELARAQSARMWELRAATRLARLWHLQGKTIEAREILAPVYDWFTEGFDTKDLKAAKLLLEELA